MPAVLLILGLVAAGVYTHSWGFYLAAGLLGGLYLLVLLIFAAIAATVKVGLDDIKSNKFKLK
jgi:hypothetical protein